VGKLETKVGKRILSNKCLPTLAWGVGKKGNGNKGNGKRETEKTETEKTETESE